MTSLRSRPTWRTCGRRSSRPPEGVAWRYRQSGTRRAPRLPPPCVRCIGWSDSTRRWLPTSYLPDAPWLPASAVATKQRRRWRRHRSRSLLDYYVGRLMQRGLKGHWTGSCLEHSACSQKQRILSLPRSPLHCRCRRSDLETFLVCPLPLQAETGGQSPRDV